MLVKITLEFANAKSAKEFGNAVNANLDDTAQAIASTAVSGKSVELAWDESCDPQELLEALVEAREELDWDF